jgi:hypothetical protein
MNSQTTAAPPEQGQLVRLRNRLFLLQNVFSWDGRSIGGGHGPGKIMAR